VEAIIRRMCILGVLLLLGCGGSSSAGADTDDTSNDSDTGTGTGADTGEDAGEDGSVDTGDGDSGPDTDTDADSDTGTGTDTSYTGEPLFDAVATYETTIAGNGDPATVYYPNPDDLTTGGYAFPVAVLLQGAKVDRKHYSEFATKFAAYGFAVVVPNHYIVSITGAGFYPEEGEVHAVLAQMKTENSGSAAPCAGALDTATLILMGHSYGGVTGMYVLGDVCTFPFCSGSFSRPAELKGAAFWGTNMASPLGGSITATANDGIPVVLVQGTLDGKAAPADGLGTYEKIADPPKAYVKVAGANHYGICNTNNPAGADADSNKPTLDQAVSVETIARWAALFLRAHVLGDAEAYDYVHATGDALDPNATIESVQ
jgi:predicted dienelactone hydrolase